MSDDNRPAVCECQSDHPAPPAAKPPRWASTVPVPRTRRNRGQVIGGAVVLVVLTALVTTFLSRVGDGGPVARSFAATVELDEMDGADAVPEDPQSADDLPPGVVDLRQGSVFLQSNDAAVNEVVAFSRNAKGALREVGRYPTGGSGTGSFEDSAQGIVLGTEQGEASPTAVIDDAQLLFVVNAGTASITVFRIYADHLERLSVTPTGGSRPVSLTVSNGVLYVLNSGEVDRRLLLGDGGALENCAHGGEPSITGFRVTGAGALTPIPDSTQDLSGGAGESGCAQVAFAPDGETLVVSERIAEVEDGKTGAWVTFPVNPDGTLGEKSVTAPTGSGPFGFTFTREGTLLSTEQNGGYTNPGGGGAAAYGVEDGQLTPVGGSVANYQTDTCWIVLTQDQRFAFATSPFEGGGISAYSVSTDGQLTLAHPSATSPDGIDVTDNMIADGVTDLALSQDGRYLYQLNSFTGQLHSFQVESDGRLTLLGTEDVFDLPPFGAGGQAAPFGIAAR